MAAIPVEPIRVEQTAELNSLCERWQQQAAIAIDTEFMRSTTFYPEAALFQVGDGQGCYLLDPLAIDDFSAFRALMLNPQVTKVMHSCSEDLEVFQTFLQVVPKPLFDTQLAAAMVGQGFSLGYAPLVERLLGVAIPKSETRSDWLQRPLSQPQLHYAALDVAYLLVVYALILKQLKAAQRLHWVQEDCAAIVEQAEQGTDPEQLYLKVKLAWKLNRQQLAVLKTLVAWRELQARARNVPRNRLVKERALWDMAARLPTRESQLKAIEGIPPRVIRAQAEELLEMIAQASELPEEQCPALLPPPLTPAEGQVFKQLRGRVREIAESLQVAPEILVRKKDLEELVRSATNGANYQLNGSLIGWRQQVVGDELLAMLNA